MLHKVIVTEIVRKVEYVEAKDKREAIDKANEMYSEGLIDFMKDVNLEFSAQYLGEVKENEEE